MEKSSKSKEKQLLRIAAVIFSLGCLIHLTHRECARMADKPPKTAKTVTYGNPTSIEANPIQDFHATAYCVTGTTRSGAQTAPGLVSADPEIIPLGSMIYVESPLMGGIYQVLDTGEMVKGKIIDIFIPSYEKCKAFGRRMVKVKILRYGFQDEPAPKAEK
jgi:3D (Asp-Asp-Asp) domain-containing protein